MLQIVKDFIYSITMKVKEYLNSRITKITYMLMAILIIVGIACDIYVKLGFPSLSVKDLHSYTMDLVQIQATFTTLTIAILALVSGVISKIHFGISISAYYLEIKPKIIKFKTALIIEFALIAVSIIGQLFELHNLVICSFFVTLMLVFCTALQILCIFEGRYKVNKEIEQYFTESVASSPDCIELGELFIEDWKSLVNEQSQNEFELHYKAFISLIDRFIVKDNNLNIIDVFFEKIAQVLLDSTRIHIKYRGINFIVDIYAYIAKQIRNVETLEDRKNNKILVIEKLYRNFWDAINSLDIHTIERIHFWLFFSSVLEVNAYTKLSQDSSINILGRSIGYLLKNKPIDPDHYTKIKWEELIDGYFYSIAYKFIPKTFQSTFMDSSLLLVLNICAGYIHNGQSELVKNRIFLDNLAHIAGINHDKSYDYALFQALLIHCYMYCLAYGTSSDKSSLSSEMVNILTDKNVVKNIASIFWSIPGNILSNFGDKTAAIIYAYDHCVEIQSIEEYVKAYYLYIILLIKKYNQNSTLLDNLSLEQYGLYLTESNNRLLRKQFIDLHGIFDENADDEKTINEMMQDFSVHMTRRSSIRRVKKASDSQNEYEKCECILNEHIRRIVTKNFSNNYGILDDSFSTVKQNSQKGYSHLKVINYLVQTASLNHLKDSKCTNNLLYPPLFKNLYFSKFMRFLTQKLVEDFNVKSKSRNNDFKTDTIFMKFIKDNNLKLLIGDRSIFSYKDNKNPRAFQIFNNFLATQDCHFIPDSTTAIVTDIGNVYVKLTDVCVEIKSPTIEQLKEYYSNIILSKDENTDEYSYCDNTGITLKFKGEDELKYFVKNEWKFIDIYLDVVVGVNMVQERENSVLVITR